MIFFQLKRLEFINPTLKFTIFQLTKIKLVDTGTKEESDVDIALNLEAESQIGK